MIRRLIVALVVLLLAGAVAFAQGPLTPAAAVTSTVYDGVTPLVPRYAVIDTAASGDTQIVAGVSGYKIRVLAGHFTMTGTAVTIRFEDTAGGTALTGQMTPSQGQTIPLPFNPVGWFETSAGNTLSLELGGGQSVDGSLVYVLVP